jgi:hypothetical protein
VTGGFSVLLDRKRQMACRSFAPQYLTWRTRAVFGAVAASSLAVRS